RMFRKRFLSAGLAAVAVLGITAWSAPLASADLFVTNFLQNTVLRYDENSGAFKDTFVSRGSGGLNFALGDVIGPDGNLYVSSLMSDQVLRYNGTTGAFLNVAASASGLTGPAGILFGRDGLLYTAW